MSKINLNDFIEEILVEGELSIHPSIVDKDYSKYEKIRSKHRSKNGRDLVRKHDRQKDHRIIRTDKI